MEFFATFPLTGAKRKTTTLINEPRKKPKISCSTTVSEIHDGNETEGDDEAEYYEESEDEGKDEDKDGQDGNEDEKKHDEDKNEEQNGKAKEYLANQQACAHDFHRVKLHDLQIRSLRDCCARLQESCRVEQQARMDLQRKVEKLMQTVNELQFTVEELQDTVQTQEEKNRRNEETIIDALERHFKSQEILWAQYFEKMTESQEILWAQNFEKITELLQTAISGPKESQA